MRINDWSSDVCSSDLQKLLQARGQRVEVAPRKPPLDLVLAAKDDCLARTLVTQQVLGEIQVGIRKEGSAGHLVTVGQHPLALVANHTAEIPDERKSEL